MVKQQALKYLGYTAQSLSLELQQLLDDCIQEVESVSQPKIYHQLYSLQTHPLTIDDVDVRGISALEQGLQGCDKVVVIAATLGVEVDKKIKYYGVFDMQRAVVFDAVASAYLEAVCDAYEAKQLDRIRTFRYAPGYSDIPLSLNQTFAQKLNVYKHLGVAITSSDLFVPMKTMLGIIGIGHQHEKRKRCNGCKQLKNCEFIRRKQTCY